VPIRFHHPILLQQRSRQTLPELPLLLVGLQLQPINSITQPLLLLLGLAHANRRHRRTASRRRAAHPDRLFGCPPRRRCGRGGGGQPALLQIALGHERLLAPVHLVQVGFDARQQRVDLGLYLGQQGRLRGLEIGLGHELEVLEARVSGHCGWTDALDSPYPGCLEHFC
jgi:hypothetical protein